MMTDDERFVAGLAIGPHPTGCVEWAKHVGSSGYGKLRIAGRDTYAHRYAYARARGPIPAGLTIDHLCRNKLCCNPAHLEAVPLLVNIWRAPNCQPQATCRRGHPKTDDNVWRQKGGGVKCKVCHRETANKSYAKRRAMSAEA